MECAKRREGELGTLKRPSVWARVARGSFFEMSGVPDWGDLYEAHAPGILAFLCGRLKDSAWAEDLLHDVFVAYRRQADPARIKNPKAYLYQAANRLSLTALRDEATARRHRARACAPWQAASTADPLAAHAVREALENLPDEDREIVTLRVFGMLTFQEIAETLGRPLPSIYKQHARAVERLRLVLASFQ